MLEVREAGVGRRMLRLGDLGAVRGVRRARPDRPVRRPGQGPRRRAQRPARPRLRDAAAHPHRRRHDRPAAGSAGRSSIASRCSSTTRCSRWSAPTTRSPAAEPEPARCCATRPGCSARRPPTTSGVIPGMIQRIGVPEERQQIFQSHAAALEEAKRGGGRDARAWRSRSRRTSPPERWSGSPGRPLQGQGSWNISILGRPAGHPRRRRDGALRHHPARHPGDAARSRRHARPVQARRARHALELSAGWITGAP